MNSWRKQNSFSNNLVPLIFCLQLRVELFSSVEFCLVEQLNKPRVLPVEGIFTIWIYRGERPSKWHAHCVCPMSHAALACTGPNARSMVGRVTHIFSRFFVSICTFGSVLVRGVVRHLRWDHHFTQKVCYFLKCGSVQPPSHCYQKTMTLRLEDL